jgi:hypothetical protein
LAIQRLHGTEVQKGVKGEAGASSHEVTVAKVTTTASTFSPNPKSSAPLKRGNTHEMTNVMDSLHSHPEEAGPARWEFDSDQPYSEAKDGSSSFLGPAALNAAVEQEVVESSPTGLLDNHPMSAAIRAALAIQRLQGAGVQKDAKCEAGQGVASPPEVAVAKTATTRALLQGPSEDESSSSVGDDNSATVASRTHVVPKVPLVEPPAGSESVTGAKFGIKAVVAAKGLAKQGFRTRKLTNL